MNETQKILRDFETQTDHLITARRPNQVLINLKETTDQLVDFGVPENNKMKIKVNEKISKYLNLAKKLKSRSNNRVTGIPIVIGALSKVYKSLEVTLGTL